MRQLLLSVRLGNRRGQHFNQGTLVCRYYVLPRGAVRVKAMCFLSLLPHVVLLSLTQNAASKPTSALPSSLDIALARRTTIKTLHAKYRHTLKWRHNTFAVLDNREDRIAHQDIYSINRGDDDEIIFGPRGDKTPQFGVGLAFGSCGELMVLSAGQKWRYHHGDTKCSVWLTKPNSPRLKDLRSVGLERALPNKSPTEIRDRWINIASKFEWSEARTTEGNIEVTATDELENDSGKAIIRFVWLIDPSKDHAILRWGSHTQDSSGSLLGPPFVCETDYKRFDGQWFPATSRSENAEFNESVEVLEASFNRPEHPKSLDTKILGLPVGVSLHSTQMWGTLPDLNAVKIWDGNAIRDYQEWQKVKGEYDTSQIESLKQRRTTHGPAGNYPSWWRKGETLGLEGLNYNPALWETYVRRWVYSNSHKRQFPITDIQRTNAAAILKSCQNDAFPVFKRIEKELSKLEAELAKPGISEEVRVAGKAKRDRLVEPITMIFNTRLKPRLENLRDEKQLGEHKTLNATVKASTSQPSMNSSR